MGTCDTTSVSVPERLKLRSAIYANVFLLNNRQSKKPTKLTLETGNGYSRHRLGCHVLNAYHFGLLV